MAKVNPDVEKVLAFIAETDALKAVERRTSPVGLARRENSAEHSWQVALSAMLLADHASQPVNLLRVLQMLLIHDIPEVDVGDVFHYDKDSMADLHARETAAAQRLFGILPAGKRDEMLALWHEFEARETADARFAAAVDRLMAFVMNANNEGGTWSEYRLTAAQVLEKNAHVVEGSPDLWAAVEAIVSDAVRDGHLSG